MKPIKDKNFDHKRVVIEGYNKCSEDYSKARNVESEPSLELLIDKIADGSFVLDLGCGAGVPVTKILSEKYKVTGVDISKKQIEQARINVPKASFIHKDILDFNFGINLWDAVISYYTIFHLTKDEQLRLFDRVIDGLKQNGYILLTLATENEPAYTEDNFFGTTMFWENYSLKEYENILSEKGIIILYSGVLNHGYNKENGIKEEIHPILFGRKDKNYANR